MKKTTIIFLFLALFVWACSDQINNKSSENAPQDSSNCESPAIKDPNNPKPMALMMRQMAANADSMRSKLLRGEMIDSLQFPFIRFYLVEPTDPNVLEPQFFENARLHQLAYKALFSAPKENKEQIKHYNLLINSCIKCHESYCSGPLKRIRKFPI